MSREGLLSVGNYLRTEMATLQHTVAYYGAQYKLAATQFDELEAELRHGPQRGSAHLRQAIEETRGGAWSAPEARAATLLRRGGLPHATRPFSTGR